MRGLSRAGTPEEVCWPGGEGRRQGLWGTRGGGCIVDNFFVQVIVGGAVVGGLRSRVVLVAAVPPPILGEGNIPQD